MTICNPEVSLFFNSTSHLSSEGPMPDSCNLGYFRNCLQSRARCRTPQSQTLVTCPGEKAVAAGMQQMAPSLPLTEEQTQSEMSSADQQMSGQQKQQPMKNSDGWPECFQDLRSWCPPDRDELNTPQIQMQDEFNFSLEGQVNNCSWELPSSVEYNDAWVNQDLLLTSPNNITAIDEENNNFDMQSNFTSPYLKVPGSESERLLCNSSVLKTKGNVLLSQVFVVEDAPPPAKQMRFSTDFTKLNSSSTAARLGSGGGLVKVEDQEEYTVPERTTVAERLQPLQVTRLPQATQQKAQSRPKLKLNIASQPSPTETDSNSNSLATPDVLKPLTDITSAGFNLLNYVCGVSDSTSRSQIDKKEIVVIAEDHDYTDEKDVLDYIKCEPLSPSYGGKGSKLSPTSIPDDEDSESDTDWYPSGERKTSGTGGPGRRRSRKASSVDLSSDGSFPQDKYRVLRDRNNEASRRSRQNRKQRDQDTRRHKSDLERKNIELKIKADRMEALVKDMRAALLKAVKSRNSSSN